MGERIVTAYKIFIGCLYIGSLALMGYLLILLAGILT